MRKIIRGTGFRGVLDYVFKRDSATKEPGRLLGGNMSGSDPSTLASEFSVTRKLRYEVKKPVWHSSLRLPLGDTLTDEAWTRIADDYMSQLGFSDSHMRCYVLHDDAEGQHIHIVASRIGLNGSLYTGQNENLESTRIVEILEKTHGLTITKGRDDASMPSRRPPKKTELEKAIRTGQAPARVVLQLTLDEVLQAKSLSASAFVERLQAADIHVKPALATTGRLSGFSFSADGLIWLKGSDLGKPYSLAGLQKRGLTYDKDRDYPALSAAAGCAAFASDTLRSPDTASHDGRSSSNGETQPRVISTNPLARREDGESIHAPSFSTEKEPLGHELSGSGDADGDSRLKESDQDLIEVSHQKDSSPDLHARRALWSATAGDLTDLAAPVTPSPMESKSLTSAQKAKQTAVTKQLDALNSPLYRITLISRSDDKKSFNLGKSNTSQEERFFAKTDVISQIPNLSRLNAKNYDIYVTPIDNAHHYILIDDMTEKSYQNLLQSDFKPCVIQQSSADNFQAVIKIPRENLTKFEQSAANQLVQNLNQDYGDPKLTGVIHPFRLAGFANKKQNRQSAFTTVILALNRFCSKSVQMLIDIRKSLKTENKRDYEHVEQNETKTVLKVTNKIDIEKLRKSTSNQVHLAIYEKLIKNAGTLQNMDLSVIDYRFCKILLKTHTKQEVMQSLASISHDLENRHKNASDYIARTVSSAENELKNEKRAKNKMALRS